jgi:eukaryotic-like serine/threonine-protein kinase
MPIQPGTRLGPYEVGELVGRGAMGVVYRAVHTGLDRDAAVKVMQALAPSPTASARFHREAKAIARLRHPNILAVYDYGEEDGLPYMVFEFLPGARSPIAWLGDGSPTATLCGCWRGSPPASTTRTS